MPRIPRWMTLVAFLCAPLLLHSQPLALGEPLALTNTRYGTAVATPLVKTNGKDFFLFWESGTNLRVTKLVEGEHRGGRHLLPIPGYGGAPAVTWTGTHFLMVMSGSESIVGQLLDANAEPAGGMFRIADVPAGRVAAASNGRTVLVLHTRPDGLHAMALTPSGEPTGVRSTVIADTSGIASVDVASNGDGFAAVAVTSSGVTAMTFDGDGRERSQTPVSSSSPYQVTFAAIGSDGRDYLAAWQGWDGRAEAVRIQADGSLRPMVMLEPSTPDAAFGGPVAVAWTGANWAVAYARSHPYSDDHPLRVAYVHPTLPQVVGREEGSGSHPSLAAANGRVLMTWRPSLEGAPAVASPLPLGAQESRPVTYAAGSQGLVGAASALDATLMVWNEYAGGEYGLRAGVRLANGDWTEREIAARGPFDGVAASDGRDFVVVGRHHSGVSAWFLNTAARVTAGPVSIPLRPQLIAWTGTDYIIGDTSSLVRLSRSGTVSPPLTLPYAIQALASNGTATVAIVAEPEDCQFLLCSPVAGRPRFVQLGPDLRPIGEPRFITANPDDITTRTDLVWDGSRFVAAWVSNGRTKIAELPLAGQATVVASLAAGTGLRMTAVQDGVALTSREETRSRIATIRRNNSVSSVLLEADDLEPLLTGLPNGRIAHLTDAPRYDAPHHGSSRIVLRVAGSSLPSKADAPRLSGMIRNGRMELAWTAPPQDVAGYRLEYRIGDGNWNELEEWFDANDLETTVTGPFRTRVPYQFRIRALNDAGPGHYSEVLVANAPKRRSVR